MPTEHSSIMGGSNAAQRINCPGSYKLEEEAPPSVESNYATQGSVFHAGAESRPLRLRGLVPDIVRYCPPLPLLPFPSLWRPSQVW